MIIVTYIAKTTFRYLYYMCVCLHYIGMSHGNVSEWNQLWDLFLNEHEPQEKLKLMLALTASKESWILTR